SATEATPTLLLANPADSPYSQIWPRNRVSSSAKEKETNEGKLLHAKSPVPCLSPVRGHTPGGPSSGGLFCRLRVGVSPPAGARALQHPPLCPKSARQPCRYVQSGARRP